YPSTAKQLVLLDKLAEELRALGLKDVVRDEHGYVFATIPATSKKKVPVIGFVAHVDTSPEQSGANVKPIVHRNWNGADIVPPDEEVGRGTEHFDVKRFGAFCAYTLDGESRGDLDLETFSADAMTITFQGFNTHPGYAKGRMVNAIKITADFIRRLPRDHMSPETTSGRDGFVHPYV